MADTSPQSPVLRDDVAELLARHLAGAPAINENRIETEVWDAYRKFRSDLHAVAGCGAERSKQDHGEFICGIQAFCKAIGI
jgi:hypothetical protein